MTPVNENALIGCLLGTTVGDSLGLPCEGLSRRRQYRMYPEIDRHHFLLGHGMISDDTEHTCMVARALIASGDVVARFQGHLAWQLRFWLLGIPAGIGFGTLRAILKLWLGFNPERSGVFSAGNGPAMRSAIIGVCFGHDLVKMKELVRASTRLTHIDPKAEYGAMAVALAAYMSSQNLGKKISGREYLHALQGILGPEAGELVDLIGQAVVSASSGQPTEAFADQRGLSRGVTGYMYHTVPVVIQCWLRNQNDYRSGILEIIRCGGDTDTTAAILGGIIGSGVGKAGIPQEWLDRVWDYPMNIPWIESLGRELGNSSSGGSVRPVSPWLSWGRLPRNLLFLLVVLLHGFRRLLPPY